MKKLFCKIALPALAALFINACSSNLEEVNFEQLSKEQRIEKLQSLHEIEENGKIALISRMNGSRMSVNSIYHYKQKSFSLEFTGPMGMSYAKIDVLKNGTTFLNVRGQLFKGDGARELLKEQFGLDIPVEDLPSIMLGTPKGDVTYDNKGYAKSALYGDEYKVDYKEYKTFRGGYPLPTFIEVVSPMAQIVIKIHEVTRIN